MKKIFISMDHNKVSDLLFQIEAVIEVANDLNAYLGVNTDTTLTKEIALDIATTGGLDVISNYRNAQEEALNAAGIKGKIKTNLMETVGLDLKESLDEFKTKFHHKGNLKFDPVTALHHISINKQGIASISDKQKLIIEDQFSNYVSTPEQLDLYHAQRAAVESLNNLREIVKKHLPGSFFVSPSEFYHTFFEFEQKDEIFSQKPLNYNII